MFKISKGLGIILPFLFMLAIGGVTISFPSSPQADEKASIIQYDPCSGSTSIIGDEELVFLGSAIPEPAPEPVHLIKEEQILVISSHLQPVEEPPG